MVASDRRRNAGLALVAVAALAAPLLAHAAEPMPHRVGQCVTTRIRAVTTRLEDGVTHQPEPGSGSAVKFTNGGYQVSYETIGAISRSRGGDRVRMCLVSIPQDCPAGDARGREYRTTNLRTGQSWRLPDAEHGCGGA
ncbi:MAG TPA: hypothetical protein VII63_00685 [Caulobacteraceae bacterium]